MYKYELTVVVSAKLDDNERTARVESVKKLIARVGGTIMDVFEVGKKKLAYEIQKMNEGYYYFITFESDDHESTSQLTKRLRIMDGILRFMCVTLDEKNQTITHESLKASKPAEAEPVEEAEAQSSETAEEAAEDTAEEAADDTVEGAAEETTPEAVEEAADEGVSEAEAGMPVESEDNTETGE